MSFIKRGFIFIFLAVAHIFGVNTSATTPVIVPVQDVRATTTVSVATSTQTTKQTTKEKTVTKAVVANPIVQKVLPQPVPIQQIPEPTPDFEKINTFARSAVVNIICTAKGNELSPVSGTGVIINASGLILTNAHIAQYFLLRDYRQKDFIDCVIRTGSPAYPRYHVELVYISPKWVSDNKTILKDQNPKGTGENDYAFLRITSSIDSSPLPAFTFIPPNIREVFSTSEPVILVSYPAGFLGGISILQNLSVASAITTIQWVSTFGEDSVDVISVGGTVVSQKGASGGAVVDKYSTLVGIISISSEAVTTGERALYAITPAYINRSLADELGVSFEQFLAQDMAKFAQKFQTGTAPLLTKIITDELNKS